MTRFYGWLGWRLFDLRWWINDHELFDDKYTLTNNLMDGISRLLFQLQMWVEKRT